MSATNDKELINSDNTDIYSCRYSSLTYAITIDIHTDDTYNAIKSFLNSSCDVHLNKNGNGIETQVDEGDKKCVITLYHNKTLFLQGKGSAEWKSKIFDPFISSLNTSTTNNQSDSPLSQCHTSFYNDSSDSLLHSTPKANSSVSSIVPKDNAPRSPPSPTSPKTPFQVLSGLVSRVRSSRKQKDLVNDSEAITKMKTIFSPLTDSQSSERNECRNNDAEKMQ